MSLQGGSLLSPASKGGCTMSEANLEAKKQRRAVITIRIREGGITEIWVSKVTLNPRQLFWIVFISAAALKGFDKLPEAIEWGKNLLALLG